MAKRNWYLEKLKTCPRCKGNKKYRSAITLEIVECKVCNGTGKVIP